MKNVDALLQWMVEGVAGAKTPVDVVARMCPDLVAAGVPVDRCEAFVRTLHPHVAGRSFMWMPGKTVEVKERSYAELHSPEMAAYAVMQVFAAERPIRRRLDAAATEADLVKLRNEGFTDWVAAPMRFISGQVHGITFATKRAGGFDDDDVAAFGRVMGPLSRVAEIFALLRTATNLLNTYVGHDAGERILAGQIQRGDTNSIHAVIWFSDLRGFTSMSTTLLPAQIIGTLNEVFDCQVPAIERHGGEVLKYMGDGMLAIFPCKPGEGAATSTGAIAAAHEAFAALDVLNAQRKAKGDAEVRFGVALHIGDISYGNIGGANRLDFTCIGPAVNLAARLETLTGKLAKNVVVSAEVAALTTTPLEPLGEFELKGVGAPVKAFAPR